MFYSIRNQMKLTRTAVATVVLAAILVLSLSATTATAAFDDDVPRGSRSTIVLVHGGWADSSGWNLEVTALEERGLPVLAPANPLRGLQSDADYIGSVLQTIEGPIVLVGHSYGGAVITNAALGVPNVKAVVYIAGFAPDKGESLAQLVTMNPGTQIVPEALIDRGYPLPGGGAGTYLYLKKSVFHEAFAADLPLEITDQMQATQRLSPPRHLAPRRAILRGRRFLRGTWLPDRITLSHQRLSDSWRRAHTRRPSKWTRRTCR